jgi:hypothetical protein
LVESGGLVYDTISVLADVQAIMKRVILLFSTHPQEEHRRIVVHDHAQLLGYCIAGYACIFEQENKPPFPDFFRWTVSGSLVLRLPSPLSIALGVCEQLELGRINIYYTDARPMFAVDEGELITMVLFWGLNLEVMVVYDLGDGGGFYVRISSDD